MVRKPSLARVRRLKSLPQTPLQAIFRHLKPSWKAYLKYVQMADRNGDKEMGKILASHADLAPREKASITPEQLCDISGVKPSALVGAVVSQIMDCSDQEASILVSSGYAGVVSTTIKSALTRKGVKDREFVLKNRGFLPTPKGSVINIPIDARRLNVSAPAALPSMEEDMLALEAGDDNADGDG